ncbi:MAG: hypothetical protein M0Z43_13175 [Acidithiobacillus sp.]|nr:hypothetical protein [Acidithiobacillus sp.]
MAVAYCLVAVSLVLWAVTGHEPLSGVPGSVQAPIGAVLATLWMAGDSRLRRRAKAAGQP